MTSPSHGTAYRDQLAEIDDRLLYAGEAVCDLIFDLSTDHEMTGRDCLQELFENLRAINQSIVATRETVFEQMQRIRGSE